MAADVRPADREVVLPPAVLDELQGVVGADRLRTGDRINPDVCHDELLHGASRTPGAVVLPATSAEVAAAVRVAARHGIPVTARGPGGDQRDDERRSALLTAIYRAGIALGGVISGEHGIGTAKKSYFQALTDPGLLDLQRGIKAVFDPAGVLNPGKVLDPA